MTESSQGNQVQKIDIKKVFHDKSPTMAKLMPGFVYAYLRRILHLDWFNGFLDRYGHKDSLEFMQGAIDEFNNKMVIDGEENIPEKGRYLFASNHPLGGFDGIMLLYILKQHYPSVIFIVNDVLMNIPGLNEFFVPINKTGGQSRDSVRLMDEAFQSDSHISACP